MKRFLLSLLAFIALGVSSSFAETVDLTRDMFHEWDDFKGNASIVGDGGCDYQLGVSTGMPYGNGSVIGAQYADLSEYETLQLTVTEGTPRLLMNRPCMDGSASGYIEINSPSSNYVKSTEGGVWVIDLAQIVADKGYAHLNVIKGANWANVTITEMKLTKSDAPAGPKCPKINFDVENLDDVDLSETMSINVSAVIPLGVDAETELYISGMIYSKGVSMPLKQTTTFEYGMDVPVMYLRPGDLYTITISALGYGNIVSYDPDDNPIYENQFVAEDEALATLNFFMMPNGYVKLTKDLFKQWNGSESTPVNDCVLDLGKSTGCAYGWSNLADDHYADLSEYESLVVTYTAGFPRIMFNQADGAQFIVSEVANTEYYTVEEVEGGKIGTVNLKKLVADKGFAHLNSIKASAYNTSTTVVSIKLKEVAVNKVLLALGEPVVAINEDEMTITFDGDGIADIDGASLCLSGVMIVANGTEYYGYADEAFADNNKIVVNVPLSFTMDMDTYSPYVPSVSDNVKVVLMDPEVYSSADFFNAYLTSENILCENIKAVLLTAHGDYEYATFCAPFAVAVPSDVVAYTITGVEGDKLVMEEVTGTIAANTPVVLQVENDMRTVVAGTVVEGTPKAGVLTGVYTETPASVGTYVMQNQNGKVGFYLVETEGVATVGANKAYLTVTAGAKAFYFDAATTAISKLTSADKKQIFDMNGRQINKLQKGINIVNGVKILVK